MVPEWAKNINKCGEWDGNCDSNSVCQTGLICGYNNCPRKYGDSWDLTDNCCFKPDLDTKATCDGIRGGKFINIKEIPKGGGFG